MWNIAHFAIQICRHRLYTGCKGCRIIGVSGFRHKRRTNPFSVYEERAQLFMALNRFPTKPTIIGYYEDVISSYLWYHFFLFIPNSEYGQPATVYTAQEVDLQKGESGVLPCRVGEGEVAPVMVIWRKGHTFELALILIIYDFRGEKWVKAGQGWTDGDYDININFSLIIENASVETADKYFCQIYDSNTGLYFLNKTTVHVYGKSIRRDSNTSNVYALYLIYKYFIL